MEKTGWKTYAEKQEIKRKALLKNLDNKLERARYECYREIQAQGGLFENIGAKQERELIKFISSLTYLNLPYHFIRELEKRIKAFLNSLKRLDDEDLTAINHFIANYERKFERGLQCEVLSA